MFFSLNKFYTFNSINLFFHILEKEDAMVSTESSSQVYICTVLDVTLCTSLLDE